MNTRTNFTLTSLLLLALSSSSLYAASRIKANNNDNLNLGSSWFAGTVPGTTDTAIWDSTVTGPNTTLVGADLTFLGVKIVNPGGLATINPGNTLSLRGSGIDLSAASQDLTLNCGVTLAAAQAWNIGSSRTLTVGGLIGGTFALTKDGLGSVLINGSVSNSFSGTPVIRAGTVTINCGSSATFGSSAGGLTFTGSGLLNYNNVGATADVSPSKATLTFTSGEGEVRSTRTAAQNMSLTFSSLGARGAGAVGLFTMAGGTVGSENKMVLTGQTTGYKKGFFVGTVAGSADSLAFYDSTAGYLRAPVYGSDTDFVTDAGGTPTIGSSTGSHVNLTGDISAQTDAAYSTLRLPGALTLTIADGQTLNLTNGAVLKQGGGAVSTITGGTLTNDSQEIIVRTDTSADLLTINSTIAGNGNLVKSGAGTLTLGATNAYSGNTFIPNGVLALGNRFALGTSLVTASGFTPGKLIANTSLTGANAVTNTLSYASPGTIRIGGVNDIEFSGTMTLGTFTTAPGSRFFQIDDGITVTLSGPVTNGPTSGAGQNLYKTGNGTLIFTGSVTNTFTRGFLVNSGTVVLRKDNYVPATSVDVIVGDELGGAGADVVRWEADEQIRDDHDLAIASSGRADLNGHTETVTKIYPFTAGLNGGQLWLGSGGTLVVSNYPASSVYNNSGVVLSGTGNLIFKDSGTRGHDWGSANTYVGSTTIDSGSFRLAASEVFPNSSDLTVNNGAPLSAGIFDLNGFNETVDGLSGDGVITNRAASGSTLTVGANNEPTATFSGSMKSPVGAINFVKIGTGTQILSGPSTYTGSTTVSGGTLEISTSGGISSTTVIVSSGAVLKLDSTSAVATNANILLSSGTPTVNLDYVGTANVDGLSLDGGATYAAVGTWGAPASGAAHTDSRFVGSGILSVARTGSTTTLASTSANPSIYGSSVTFTATVVSLAGTPTGIVVFMDGTNTLGNGILDGLGQATFATSALSVSGSPHSITASYSGDSGYLPSTSSAYFQAVTPAASSLGLVSSVNPSAPGANVTFTATASSGAGTPSGNVVFSANGTPFSTNVLVAGVAAADNANLPLGTNTILAAFAAQGDYGASSASLDQVVMVVYSTINTIISIANNHNGTSTLTFQGTPKASYYVVDSADIAALMSTWTPVAGSTNAAPDPSGIWSLNVTNSAAQRFFRAVAVNPAP